MANIIVTFQGIDDRLAATVHTRYAYNATDIVFDRRFADVVKVDAETGVRYLDFGPFHDTESRQLRSVVADRYFAAGRGALWMNSSSSCFFDTGVGHSVIRSEPFCVFGNAITSRSESAPVISIARRSRPNAIPRGRRGPYSGTHREQELRRTRGRSAG